MKNLFFIFLFVFLFGFGTFAQAGEISSRLKGRILLDVERNGEAWYVNPADEKRYYLGRPDDAFKVMRQLGIGISEANFARLPKDGDTSSTSDMAFGAKLQGKIMLEVEKKGEAWYINPKDYKAYYLGKPADAFAIMRKLSLGISRRDLAMVHKVGATESIDEFSSYEHTTVTVASTTFKADIIRIDLSDPDLEIITDTTNKTDCDKNCPAETLADFVVRHDAFAGINATYFDTSAAKRNYYFFPVWNTDEKILINEDQLKYWTTGPIMAFDAENGFHYFKDSREFESVENFEKTTGKKLQAALGNKPRLIEEGMNQLIPWDTDVKQQSAKAMRNALGYTKDPITDKETLMLIILHDATVIDLAEALKVLKVDYALNLDGGYSSALWYNDEYMVKPGRNIPNAIVFRKKADNK
jgi:exopolysaccharide biosynthesis protein